MRLISEDEIRSIVEATSPRIFYIPPGKVLSPAARDYLNRQLIKIDVERNREINEAREAREARLEAENSLRPGKEEQDPAEVSGGEAAPQDGGKAQEDGQKEPAGERGPSYVDYETGAVYAKKPECMTQIMGNKLVFKNAPEIRFRGKLDSLQAEIILAQCRTEKESGSEKLIRELGEILDAVRRIMRAEVCNEPLKEELIIGLNLDELREQSHHPAKYFSLKNQKLPDYSMGLEYALLNALRASIREAEVLAVDAYMVGRKVSRTDIIEELNRLSSALHIMMMRYETGAYR